MQDQTNTTYTGIEELKILELMKNYNNAIVKDSIKYSRNSKTVIDFGAGIGTLSIIFRKKFHISPICIEIDDVNIKYIRKRKFKVLKDIQKIIEPVDLVFSSNVLEHIKDDHKILKILRDKLNKDGTLYLYLPAKMILWTKLDEIVGHYRRYEIDKLKALCNKSGFQVIRLHYSDCLGFFTTLTWKFLNIFANLSFPSRASLVFYDNLIFPISRFLDNVGFKYLLGKNIILVAKKKNK